MQPQACILNGPNPAGVFYVQSNWIAGLCEAEQVGFSHKMHIFVCSMQNRFACCCVRYTF
jgi:hypothetical protein